MANAGYDKLTITVDVDSGNANRNINKLSSNLQHFNETAKNLDKRRINEVKGLLQDIANIDFSNVSKGLQDVVSAFKAFSNKSFMKATNQGGNLSGVFKKPDMSIMGNPANALKDIDFSSASTSLMNISQYSKEWKFNTEDVAKAMQNVLTPMEQLGQDLEQAGLSGEQMKTVFNGIDAVARKINGKQIKDIEKALKKAGYSGKQVQKIIKQIYKDSNKKGFGKGASEIGKHFKTILRQRILRKIIQELYKLLTDGVKNIASFDSKTNEALTQIKNSFLFLTNSLGSMFAPLIQMIAPIITELTNMLGDLANMFAEVFASANGQTTFAKAKKDLEGFNEEAKKTQALGIDELNVFQKEDDASGMFTNEEVKLGEETQGIAGAIKNLFAEIKKIVEKIKPIINDLVSKSLPAISNLLTPIMEIISTILDLILTLVGQTFGDVNQSLVDFTNMIASILGFVSNIVNMVATVLKPVIHMISAVINIINSALGGIFKVIGGIFDLLSPILKIVNILLVPLSALLTCVSTIFYVIEGIVKTIIKIITLDWFTIGETWEDVGNKIKQAWKDMGDIASQSVQGFASGGFPEDGLFFANHNELVGRFENGKTAVANNEQITQGIYEAVRDAMKESGGQGNISIQIDGYELAKIITKKQNNMGADLINGNNLVWGK